MESEKFTDKEIEQFCENEFIEEELASKLHKFLLGENASIETQDSGGDNYSLIIEMPLREG